MVKVHNQLSAPVHVSSGVPQGSHLGPLLFLLFINDLRDIFQNRKFLLYADDLNVFRTIRFVQDGEKLQDDLYRFERWCTANKMQLNTAKCVLIKVHRAVSCVGSSYSLGDVPLIEVAEVRDLGVTIVPSLDFHNHYRSATSKAMQTLGLIARFGRQFRRVESLNLLYVSLVRPLLEYASVVWNPRHKIYISLVERVQHRFLRLASRVSGCPMSFDDHDYGPILRKIRFSTLSDRRIVSDLMFLYKIIHGQIDCPELLAAVRFHAPQRQLRPRPLFDSKMPLYQNYTADPINRAMETANQYLTSIELFSTSRDSFRNKLLYCLNNPS